MICFCPSKNCGLDEFLLLKSKLISPVQFFFQWLLYIIETNLWGEALSGD